jgi:serine/threonine-protein kinase
MEAGRWEKIQELFHGAVDLPAAEQRAYLHAACAGDAGLCADVLALLDEDARRSSPLERSVAGVAGEVLAAASAPMAARQLGPYRVGELLGEGGMGAVYLAERTDLGSRVAIKVLAGAWLSPSRRERFAAEQRTLARLDHPSIARLYDAGALEDGTPFFVMEYVDGKPLTEHCRERGLGVADRLRLYRTLCEAVQFAHRHAVIHRDIKPSNVLVKRDGSVRLLDFGIAKHLEHVDENQAATRTGVRAMTPAYAAPEQHRGERVGIYTDVYSLGVVLYELLAGRLPAPGGAPQRPSLAAGGGPAASRADWADLDVLVMTAMHADPQRRYASVDALIRDVDHFLAGAPLDARPDSFGYRLRKFVARHRRAVILAALALLAIVGLVAFFTARLTLARNAALAEAARTARIRQFMERLLTGGDDEVGPGKELRVITLLDRGRKEAAALDADPEVQADLLQTLGAMYGALGERESAGALLRAALEKQEALHGKDSVATIDGLTGLANLADEQARYDESEALYRRALDIARPRLPADDDRMVRTTLGLGRTLTNRGSYGDAIPLLEQALRLQEAKGAPPRTRSDTITLLANAQFYVGRLAESDALHRRALRIDRETLGARHPNVADDLYSLGAVQFEWGRYDEAERIFREAVGITEGHYGREHAETASGLTMLGRTLVAANRLPEAAALLGEALAINERSYGKVHPRVASALGELGHVALRQDRIDEAEALYRRQEDIYQEVYPGKHYLKALAHVNVGSAALARKELPAAERIIREGLELYRDTVPNDHPRLAVARIRLGRVLVLQRRFAEARLFSLAGHEVLVRHGGAPAAALKMAREDLAASYTATGHPELAARYAGALTP